MEHDDVLEIRTGGFEHAVRRVFAVNLAIAFVGENDETEAARQRGELFEIREIGDRALRIGRRGEIDRNRARQQLISKRIEIGQEAGGFGCRQIDRLAIGGDRAGGIGGINGLGISTAGLPARCGT